MESKSVEIGILDKIVEVKDDIDRFINQLPQEFGGRLAGGLRLTEQKKEEFFGAILNCSLSLFKANDAIRTYIEEEEKSTKQFLKRIKKDTNKEIILGELPLKLLISTDVFFIQAKSGLDHLAQTLNPLLNVTIDGWHKGNYKGRRNISGGRVLNILNNLAGEEKQKIAFLIKFIEDNLDWITYIVKLRDNPLHEQAQPDNIIPMRIRRSEKQYLWKFKKIISSDFHPLLIKHPNNESEILKAFLNRTMRDVLIFIETFLFHAFKLKSIDGVMLVASENPLGIGHNFNWAIPNSRIQKE